MEPEFTKTDQDEPKLKVKRGRPKKEGQVDKKQYFAEYYAMNKEKTKGDVLCPHCNLYSSRANISRHNKKYHPELIKQK